MEATITLEKLIAHQAAAVLAAAVIGKVNVAVPVDTAVADANLRALNLMTWEIHRIFYAAIVDTVPATNWKDPLSAPALPDLLGKALSLATDSGIKTLIQNAINGLAGPVAAQIAEPIPNPGA